MLAAPLHAIDKSVAGGMIIVYDTGYIRAEIFRVWSRVFVHIAGMVLVIVAITLLIVRWSLAGPIARAAAVDECTPYRAPLRTSTCQGSRFFPAAGAGDGASGGKHAPGTRGRGDRSQTAEHQRISLDRRAAGRPCPHQAGWQQPVCGLQSRALRSQPPGQHHHRDGSGQRPGNRHRADTLRLQRNLGRSGKRDCGQRNRR